MGSVSVGGEVAEAARRLHADECSLAEFLPVFAAGFFYTRTSAESPKLFVADVSSQGCWACVFTTKQRLASHAGECDYLGLSGGEFARFVPADVGLVIDVEDEHAVSLPPSVLAEVATMPLAEEE
ncbi:hypothetical protein FHR84_003493 [Actinopolyspora biskrensis]|uniref:SseB protein N-terminal domain-containing protein n=1 Tax=Actinopolyspora biskrensis TaxID=1470178 RepID=A0A852YYI0_9ACTN|nr:SseB family protein [Actinopolyspora biskrensis]NYH80144.1 hypothetical protein [Actinopolyspora biskrensis]